MTRTATITFDGKSIELPMVEGSEGELGIDISQLSGPRRGLSRSTPGSATPGPVRAASRSSTARRASSATAGIPIDVLAEQIDVHRDVAWLLMPRRRSRRKNRTRRVSGARLTEPRRSAPRGVRSSLRGLPGQRAADGHALGDDQHALLLPPGVADDRSPTRATAMLKAAATLISKVRTIAAYSYRRSLGLPFIYPDPKLEVRGRNFLHMMFSQPFAQQHIGGPGGGRGPQPDPASARRPRAELFDVDRAGRRVEPREPLRVGLLRRVRALWGPLHGGANVAVLEMLEAIRDKGRDDQDAPALELAKKKDMGLSLMGFRPPGLQELRPEGRRSCGSRADKVLGGTWGVADPLLDVAQVARKELGAEGLYFVDAASFTRTSTSTAGHPPMRAMGIPTNMFTVIFAIGRDARLDRPPERAARRPTQPDLPARGRSTRGRRSLPHPGRRAAEPGWARPARGDRAARSLALHRCAGRRYAEDGSDQRDSSGRLRERHER